MALLTDFLLTELLIELGRWWSDMCLAAGSNGFNSLTYLLTYLLGRRFNGFTEREKCLQVIIDACKKLKPPLEVPVIDPRGDSTPRS